MKNSKNDKFLVFNRVSKSYGKLLALDDVSFELNEGDIFGYIGPNGAGKTTTIKIMVGLIRDFSGSYSLAGLKMPGHLPNVQRLAGYLPQDVGFQDWRTVNQALKTLGSLSGLADNQLEKRIDEALELLDLSAVKHKKIPKLSGGMVQKVGLAQALLHQPKLLVLDEPLSGLDPASRHMMKKTIQDLSKNGTTVFFSSHILSDVQDIATKIGILNKGQIIKIGALNELQSYFVTTNQIEITFSQPSEHWNNLKTIKGVTQVELVEADKLVVSMDKNLDIDEISYLLLKKLMELECRIRCFKPVIPNLDDLYLKFITEDQK